MAQGHVEKKESMMRNLLMLTSILAFSCGHAFAAEQYVGTWSGNRSNCTAVADVQRQTVYTLYRDALSVPALGCEHATFLKTPTGWVARASQCYGSNPSAEEPFSRVIHIVVDGATVRLTWPGFDSGVLVRC
ncbi:hypothetical protein [Mesorhizobium sp. M1348]|uniref:hypothetical protein n=1 Tax=unclassified Mesorhizobium TaxID=325217 RepID=UPI0033383E61